MYLKIHVSFIYVYVILYELVCNDIEIFVNDTDDSLCFAIIALNANTSLACDMMTCLWHTYSLSLDIHPLIC